MGATVAARGGPGVAGAALMREAQGFVTLLMELDLWLFGRLRSGSYFIVVEK
jgi:hypothetical protein